MNHDEDCWKEHHECAVYRIERLLGFLEMIDATTTRCTDCGTDCTVDRPCRCCLAAEVEALRAQVQRVRDVCKTHHMDDSYPKRRKVVFLDRVLRALDGENA
jgi:hypothetical protein